MLNFKVVIRKSFLKKLNRIFENINLNKSNFIVDTMFGLREIEGKVKEEIWKGKKSFIWVTKRKVGDLKGKHRQNLLRI